MKVFISSTYKDLLEYRAAAIRAVHPYELPEILAVPVCDGTSDYLAWIDAETRTR